jgi:peptide/nickel transport system permease protein
MGTDEVGRDILSGVIFGLRMSMRVGLVAMVIAATFRTLLGLAAGYAAGRVDTAIMRVAGISRDLEGDGDRGRARSGTRQRDHRSRY